MLAAVLISAANAVVRKAFSISSNAYLEIQWYLFAAVFLSPLYCGFWARAQVETFLAPLYALILLVGAAFLYVAFSSSPVQARSGD